MIVHYAFTKVSKDPMSVLLSKRKSYTLHISDNVSRQRKQALSLLFLIAYFFNKNRTYNASRKKNRR
jgi:hypothetical protein